MPLCRAVAAAVAVLPPDKDGLDGPIERLAKRPHPIVRLDTAKFDEFNSGEAADAFLAAAVERFASIPRFVERARFVIGERDAIAYRRMGQTDVQAMEIYGSGTMHCSEFYFFAERAGAVRPVPNPPQWQAIVDTEEEPAAFCDTATAMLGVVAGSPAFITETRTVTSYDYRLSIAAWDGKGWARPCAIEVKHRVLYSIYSIHCAPSVCRALRPMVPRLASAMRVHVEPPPYRDFVWPQAASTIKRVESLRREVNATDFTKGPDAQGVHGEVTGGFSYETPFVAFPLRLAGRDYVALMGSQGVGWRIEPGFGLLLYDRIGGEPRIVASAVIDGRKGGLQSVRYGRWRSMSGGTNSNRTELY